MFHSIGPLFWSTQSGIATAKVDGAYKGRPANLDLHKRISESLVDGKSIQKVAELLKCSNMTVQKVRQLNALEAAQEAFQKEYAILDEKIERSNMPSRRLLPVSSCEHEQ